MAAATRARICMAQFSRSRAGLRVGSGPDYQALPDCHELGEPWLVGSALPRRGAGPTTYQAPIRNGHPLGNPRSPTARLLRGTAEHQVGDTCRERDCGGVATS